MTNGSVIENLHIQNWPAHGFSIGSSSDLTIRNVYMDNSFGDLPNNRSKGLSAAHNSDGFGVGTLSSNILIDNCTVYNQDDCVAVTSGNNITASNIFCSGTHGLSIGSIGGKANNNVTNVLVRPTLLFLISLPPPTALLTSQNSSLTPPSATPQTAPALSQTSTPPATSPTSPTPTFKSLTHPTTVSTSNKIISTVDPPASHPTASLSRMCFSRISAGLPQLRERITMCYVEMEVVKMWHSRM